MKRRTLILVAALVLLVIASIFAPVPFSRTVEAGQGNACQALYFAYQACAAHNPDPVYHCAHILEQLHEHCVSH